MNVLIAADYATPFSGNFVGSLIELLETMTRNGDKVIFAFPKNTNTMCHSSWVQWIEQEGGRVYLCDMNCSFDEQLQFLRKIIIDHSIEILHIHFGLFHHLAIHNREKLPVKIVIHEHMEYPVGCNKAIQTVKYMFRSAAYRIKRIAFVSVNKQIYRAHPFC